MKKIIIIGLLGVITLASCGSHKGEKKEEILFTATSPIIKDTLVSREYVCQIHAISHIELRAQEKGFLQDIYIDEGQSVKKGDILFGIMPKLYEAELHKAQAEADYAEIEYKNMKMLADSNVVSGNQLALVKAKFEKAKAELELAKVHLGFTQIKAPFDGIIDKFHVRLGSLLEEGELLTNLADNSQMWVYFNVPEAEYLDYRTKVPEDSVMEVALRMANNQLFDYKGKVETIEADFNNETGNIAFRATFPNPKKLLRHGETGNIIVDQPLSQAMLIPQKATFEVLDKKYVYVIDENNVLKARKIEVQAEMKDLYVVSSGLSLNDKILLEGLRNVRENDKINYEFENPEDVINHLGLHAE
ncbi:MAG: efflux RND transporter periplasmic adaptor subunit [Putridiphycobacter sp.]